MCIPLFDMTMVVRMQDGRPVKMALKQQRQPNRSYVVPQEYRASAFACTSLCSPPSSTVLFSATLSPPRFYSDMLGLPETFCG